MIPKDKIAAVEQGLVAAFGVKEFEDIRQITKGRTSALVFRIVVGGKPYLLRLIMYKNTFLGPERHFTCLKAAAAAGLAPRVWYTSVEHQLSITDFVEEVPFPAAAARMRMPGVLRALHALPPFPEGVDFLDTSCLFLLHKGAAVDGFLQKFQAAQILPASQTAELLGCLARLSEVYVPQAADMVSSHNDLFKPDNILFDGNRVWLVDWEAAFLNDRYADLAVVTNMLAATNEEAHDFLKAYLREAPDEYQLARLFLMRQLTNVFYALAFLFAAAAEGPVEDSPPLPDWNEFQRRFWAGEVNLVDRADKSLYGRLHVERLMHHLGGARYQEALRVVSRGA